MSQSYSLDQVQAFVAVADTGSFSAAGRRLHRVQSAVSYAIGQLEQSLHTCLFDRSGRRPVLTLAGSRLLAEARAVLVQAEQLSACAERLRAGDESRVRLMADALFPTGKLADTLETLSTMFPHTLLHLRSGLMNDVVETVLSDSADVGICNLAGRAVVGLDATYLGSVALVPVCASTHSLAAAPETLSTALLERSIQVVHAEHDDAGSADQGVISLRTWRVTSLDMKLELIRRGVGWGSLPSPLIAAQLASGSLVKLRPQAWTPAGHSLPMHAVVRRGAPRGQVTTWLCQALRFADAI